MTRVEEIFLELIDLRNNCAFSEDYDAYEDAIDALKRVGVIAHKREEALIDLIQMGQDFEAVEITTLSDPMDDDLIPAEDIIRELDKQIIQEDELPTFDLTVGDVTYHVRTTRVVDEASFLPMYEFITKIGSRVLRFRTRFNSPLPDMDFIKTELAREIQYEQSKMRLYYDTTRTSL